MKVDLIELFSIPLFHFKINPKNKEEIKSFILNNHKKYSESDTSNEYVMGNNTNYSDSLIEHSIFKSTIEEIEINLRNVFENFYCYNDIIPFVCDIWTTCVKPKEFGPNKHFHTHSNSLFSGVWYPFEINSSIMFKNEKKDFFTLPQDSEKILDKNKKFMYNEYSITKILPQEDTVILFPSFISHAVSYHENVISRYSVPFNVFFRGNLKTVTANLNIRNT